jgi:hypothetical protein
MDQQTPNQLTISDFNVVVGIIDACTERGAFKGSELTAVGTVRDKFVAFLRANEPAAQAEAAPPPATALDEERSQEDD